jgi:hypothetical protein
MWIYIYMEISSHYASFLCITCKEHEWKGVLQFGVHVFSLFFFFSVACIVGCINSFHIKTLVAKLMTDKNNFYFYYDNYSACQKVFKCRF